MINTIKINNATKIKRRPKILNEFTNKALFCQMRVCIVITYKNLHYVLTHFPVSGDKKFKKIDLATSITLRSTS